MKSPFPGMDPYLERYWSTVHFNLIAATQRLLRPLLPAGLAARAEENVTLEGVESEPLFRPDSIIVEERFKAANSPTPGAGSVVTLLDSYEVAVFTAPRAQRDLRIVDTADNDRVITAIEILSPGNKTLAGSEEYRRKLDHLRIGNVSIVEIDLVRYPSRGRLEISQEELHPDVRAPYLVCTYRSWRYGKWRLTPIPLRSRLPSIPVPLRQADTEVLLDLQAALDDAYEQGSYGPRIYRHPLDPPLHGEDAPWAAELLKTLNK